MTQIVPIPERVEVVVPAKSVADQILELSTQPEVLMTQIVPIPERVEVVVPAKSVADQILELPIGSVVLIKSPFMSTVLHRTGADGWLSTSPLRGVDQGARAPYYNNTQVRVAIQHYEANDTTFILAEEAIDED